MDPDYEINEDNTPQNPGDITPSTGTKANPDVINIGVTDKGDSVYMIDNRPYIPADVEQWYFQCLACQISLGFKPLSIFITKLKSMDYKVTHPVNDLGHQNKDRLKISCHSGKIDIIKASNNMGTITYVTDFNRNENSPSDIVIKMAIKFKGNLKGFMIPMNIKDQEPIPVLIYQGQPLDISQYKIDIVKKK